MQLVIREEIGNVFKSFGISDVQSIIKNEAIMLLLSKESKYQAEYDSFKNRYNSEFAAFKQKIEASGKEDFEVEDDLMDWEFADNALKNIGKQKRLLIA